MNSKIVELANKYTAIQTKHEALTDEVKALNVEWTETETLLLEAMIEEGVKTIALDGLGTFSMVVKNYLSLNAANKPEGYAYLKESGNGALLKEEVNPRTLTAFLKGHLETKIKEFSDEGLDVVDSRNKALEFLKSKGFNYFSDRGISLRKG